MRRLAGWFGRRLAHAMWDIEDGWVAFKVAFTAVDDARARGNHDKPRASKSGKERDRCEG